MNEFGEIWVYLRTNPLMHLTLTLVAYQIGNWIYKKTNLNPLFNPVLIAIIIIVPILLISKTSYADYFQGAQFVHFLLGPATVALAIPLYQQFEKVKQSAFAISASILTGSITAMLSAIFIGKLLNSSTTALISLAPKSTTTPVCHGYHREIRWSPLTNSNLGDSHRYSRRYDWATYSKFSRNKKTKKQEVLQLEPPVMG